MKYPDDAMGQCIRCADPDRVAGSRAVAGWLAVRIDDAAMGCCLQTGEEMTARDQDRLRSPSGKAGKTPTTAATPVSSAQGKAYFLIASDRGLLNAWKT
jgi:hypothetical protein